jgi:hypothetical protein
MNIPVIFCVDVEPDPRLVNRFAPEPWLGYEFTQRYLAELRGRIETATGAPARYSWFLRMDPQVAEAYGGPTFIVDRYERHLKEVDAAGDEIGLHTHLLRWLDDRGTWLHDFGNQQWAEHCVRMSVEAFARALGRPCVSMRLGDRWLNTATVNLLEALDIRYDLTAEPGTRSVPTPKAGELASGPLPDYARVPREPWRPSETDFRRPANRPGRRIRMIPLTSGHRKLGLNVRRHLRRIRASGVRYRRQDTPLYMFQEWRPPDTFGAMLDRALAAQRNPYLAFAIRTDIGAEARFFRAVNAALEALLAHPAAPRFRFCTPAAALEMLGG